MERIHKTLETMCNARAWPQQCWKNGANGSNIAALRFDDHGTKKCCEMLTQQFDRFQTLHKNSHQHAPTRDRVCKRTQHVTSNNVGGGGGRLLASNAASVRTGLYNIRGLSDVLLVLWSRAIGFERIDY